MLVHVTIDRVPEEGENSEEIIESVDEMPFGSGRSVAQFTYDPTSKQTWKYLFDLQECLFQLMRHEMSKAYNHEEMQRSEENNEENE